MIGLSIDSLEVGFPEFNNVIPVKIYGGLIFVFELAIGFWLQFKGLRSFRIAELDKAVG
jgi:hypothetical protein